MQTNEVKVDSPCEHAEIFQKLSNTYQTQIREKLGGSAIVICRHGKDHLALGMPIGISLSDALILVTEGLRAIIEFTRTQTLQQKPVSPAAATH